MFKFINSKIFRIILFSACLFFIFSNFNFKIAVIKASHIIEIINQDFYPDLNKKKIGNITFLYDTLTSNDDILYINDVLDKNKNSILDILKIQKEPEITIRVLSEFNDSHSDSLGYVYFHNNIINVLNSDSHEELTIARNDKEALISLSETLIHEYTHALINHKLLKNEIYPQKLPFWFNEGIAECMGKFAIDESIPSSYNSDITPSDLDRLFDTNSDLFYEKSSIFVNSIIENHGIDKIGSILDYLEFFNFEESLEKATLSDIDDISMDAFNTSYK
ncbi:hypothetical protein [uncultured Clostridium sp.]|uniref:hypothetical protein n=1 Tax=uncultured Clostridium sp. TaxID=59620 RepID=UPI002617FE2C|nr:hypothetical protein [uncultured Clostridium sp.]